MFSCASDTLNITGGKQEMDMILWKVDFNDTGLDFEPLSFLLLACLTSKNYCLDHFVLASSILVVSRELFSFI